VVGEACAEGRLCGPWRVWFWNLLEQSVCNTQASDYQDPVKATIAKNLREPGRIAALHVMIGLSKADTAVIVSLNRVPALVVMDTRDPAFPDPIAEAHWLAAQLHADSLIVDGAGHYLHTEMPKRIAPKLLTFIARAHVGG
jgi:pimeloyl-ACP methyl ester carboxylesterase